MFDDMTVLPNEGFITLNSLCEYLEVTDVTLITKLNKYGIPFVKLSAFHKHWLVNMEHINLLSHELYNNKSVEEENGVTDKNKLVIDEKLNNEE